ncbi:MAG: penicillin-binding protein 2 [Kiloniellales bacterium]
MSMIRDDSERSKTLTRRTLLVGGAQMLLLSGLAGRLYYLQIVESARYRMLAEDNRINLRLLTPPRGRILDRYGVPIADNQQNYRVVLVREQARDVKATLDSLSGTVELSEYDYERILREALRKRAFVPVAVKDFLSWEQVSRIEVNAPDLPGVSIEVGRTRSYPRSESMTHILGYVAAVSEREQTGDPLLELPDFRIGKQGIEKEYDLQLRGSAGNSHLEVNALGRVIREVKREEGKPGKDLVLTVDAELQKFTHERLMGERGAAAVVMDVENGDVLALASVPSYDPNLFNKGLTGAAWHALINDSLAPLTNKAIAGQYAPGSTFKMMVALAGLESGISPLDTAYCPGFLRLGNARFHCWKRGGHGRVDMYDGIKRSCDVFFYELARKVGIDRIAEMANRFGLGAPVGIDLPGERGGMIPTRAWKKATLGEPWQGGETLVSAIGQGFVLSTPLQLAVMVARIANGGYAVTPRLTRLAGDKSDKKPDDPADTASAFPSLGISEASMRVIHTAMDLVSNNPRGTAYRARIKEEGWELAGKTGTSQVRRITMAERAAGIIKNKDLPWRRRDHALFVAYAPVHRPRYACAVVVEHGGGGSKVAAPIVRDILIETQRRDPAAVPPIELLAGGRLEEA